MKNYRIYTNDKDTVVAVRTYHGQNFRGVAKCNTEVDTFDIDFGTNLAKARCDYAVAKARMKYFQSEVDAIMEAEECLERERAKLVDLYYAACDDYDTALKYLYDNFD